MESVGFQESAKREFSTMENGVAAVISDREKWEAGHVGERSVVIVAGPTGSGKSTFADRLEDDRTTVLHLDNYFKDASDAQRPGEQVNWSTPDVLDADRIRSDVAKILAAHVGNIVEIPTYDKRQSMRVGEEGLTIRDRLVIEGVYAIQLFPNLTPFEIYLDGPQETLLARKIDRDTTMNGRTEEEVRRRFAENVIPVIERHVSKQKNQAKYVVHNG